MFFFPFSIFILIVYKCDNHFKYNFIFNTEQARHLTDVKRHVVAELEQLEAIVGERLLTTPVELEERKYYIGKVVQRVNTILIIKEKLQHEYDIQMKIKLEEVRENRKIIYYL